MAKNLGEKLRVECRKVKNIITSSFSHPLQNTEINHDTGLIVRHYTPFKEQKKYCSLSNSLKLVGYIFLETFLHPTKNSYVNRKTFEITRD